MLFFFFFFSVKFSKSPNKGFTGLLGARYRWKCSEHLRFMSRIGSGSDLGEAVREIHTGLEWHVSIFGDAIVLSFYYFFFFHFSHFARPKSLHFVACLDNNGTVRFLLRTVRAKVINASRQKSERHFEAHSIKRVLRLRDARTWQECRGDGMIGTMSGCFGGN